MAGAFKQRVVLWFVAAVVALALGPATAGAATASWAFEPASVDFGVLLPGEASAPTPLKLANTGEVTLDIELVTLGSEGEFLYAPHGCGGPLAPGSSCEVDITFKPRSPGRKEATLEVFDANGNVPPAVARLTGTEVSPAVTIDPAVVDFGTVPTGPLSEALRTATLTNQGPGGLSLKSAEFFVGGAPSSGGPLLWAGSTCKPGTSLPPGASCTVTFRFVALDPTVAAGELRITDNAADSPQVIQVRATAAAAPPSQPAPPPQLTPSLELSGHPGKRTKSRVAAFTFSGNQDTTQFECRLDQAAFRRCTSPARYTSLKPGKHRFWVRPIGTFPTPVLGPAVSYAWRVIGPPPKKAHRRRP